MDRGCNSGTLEAGWFVGKGKPVYVLTRDGEEPELMAKMCTAICTSWSELLDALTKPRTRSGVNWGIEWTETAWPDIV